MKRRKKAMMKIKSLYLIILLLLSGQLFAQPGGGGGLWIDNFYNDKLEKINIDTDASIKIRAFILDGETVFMERFPASKSLPPVNTLNVYEYLYTDSNQRMYIISKKDTMIVDFVGIIGENGAGHSDQMDSLVIQKGYFKYYRNKKDSKSYNNEDWKRRAKLLGSGLTLNNKKQLLNEGYLEYSPRIDLSFLSDENHPASYFFKKAAYYLERNQTELAMAELGKGTKKNDIETCETLYILNYIHTKTGQYEKAIDNISKAINRKCKRYSYDINENLRNEIDNYRTRIELFIKLKKYDKAAEDYDMLYDISLDKIEANVERANFKMRYLKNYKVVINDLKKTIDKIPAENAIPESKEMPFTPFYHLLDGNSRYYDTYFIMAMAEYLKGEKKLAYRHWLKAEESGPSTMGRDFAIIHFDSIINQHPKIPELYLARAIAYSKKGHWDDEIKYYNNAITDIRKAEELGMTDYRINMYSAKVLKQLGKYDEALKEIDKAILKHNPNPICFLIRRDIREDLGLKDGEFNGEDPDYKQYQLLSKNWKWKKY